MTDKQQKQVSIIIRSFNEEQHIEKLLRGIIEQTYKNIEIILVDSGSTDNTVAIARKYDVKIVQIKPEDFTFGYSLNQGCRAASGDYLLMASAHVYPVYVDWIERMIDVLQDEAVGLVYGKQRGNELSRYSERQIFKKWFPEEADFNQPHTFCNNANAAIKRSHWLAHPYDEELTGLEDIAWATHIKSQGLRIAYEPRAEIIHVHDETFERTFNRYRREAIALRAIHKDQSFNLLDFLMLCSGNIISDCFHAVEEKCFSRSILEVVQFRFAQFWGTYRGCNEHSEITRELRKKFYYPKTFVPTKKMADSTANSSSTIKY